MSAPSSTSATTNTIPPAPPGPPFPKNKKYSPKDALDDLPRAHHALNLFMASYMVESEEYCKAADPKSERLFMASGYGAIQAVKAMMSFEDSYLLSAIEGCKHGLAIAQTHRKRAPAFTTRLAGFVTGGATSGVGWIKTMNAIERHAELVYAETLFEKALLGIVYSGDWLAFIKEALNLRSTMNIYHTLGKFVTEADAAHPSKHDPSLDAHFRSGVYLGVGASHLVMSLMPSRLQTIVEFLGYSGDRATALALLSQPGGWTTESDEPGVSAEQEGTRRTLCDVFLLVFHLVLSAFTFVGVDIAMADKIVRWNLKRYPNGIVFRFGEGRLAYRRSQPAKAIASYGHAMNVQEQFRSLQFVSYWEIAVANFSLWDIPAARECWRKLVADATWSKAVYTYSLAACLLEEGDASREEADALLKKVPDLRQRIAGKSIPLEKFVARRAQQFTTSPKRAPVLPVLEIAYVLGAVSHTPRAVLVRKMLPLTRAETSRLAAASEKEPGHWDDAALARFLQGVCALHVAHPDPEAVPEEDGAEAELSKDDAEREAKQAFEDVLSWGPKLEVDHHLVFHAHYELGRLLSCSGDNATARKHFEIVASGKPAELANSKRTGKYSMENVLTMRNHAAIEALDGGGRL